MATARSWVLEGRSTPLETGFFFGNRLKTENRHFPSSATSIFNTMPYVLLTYELHRILLIAGFLICFIASRLIARRAYGSLSKESLYQLNLEFGRFARIFVIIFVLLGLEVAYLYFRFEQPFRYRIIVETVVTTLSIALGVSQAITIYVIRKSILTSEEKRRFGKSIILGIAALAALCVLVITFQFS